MTDEFRSFHQHNTGMTPRAVLDLATRNGARALGLAGSLGELSVGAWADLAVIPDVGSAEDAEEAVMHHAGDVLATMIDGQWAWRSPVYPAGEVATAEEAPAAG